MGTKLKLITRNIVYIGTKPVPKNPNKPIIQYIWVRFFVLKCSPLKVHRCVPARAGGRGEIVERRGGKLLEPRNAAGFGFLKR